MYQDGPIEGRVGGTVRGQSPIFSVGCVGRLASVQALADGRSNILLQGLERYEIQEEFLIKVIAKPYYLKAAQWSCCARAGVAPVSDGCA